MNKRNIFIAMIALLLIGFASFMFINKSDSLCTDEDYATNNCIPAGKCHPNPSIDAVIDCDVKDYDRPLNDNS